MTGMSPNPPPLLAALLLPNLHPSIVTPARELDSVCAVVTTPQLRKIPPSPHLLLLENYAAVAPLPRLKIRPSLVLLQLQKDTRNAESNGSESRLGADGRRSAESVNSVAMCRVATDRKVRKNVRDVNTNECVVTKVWLTRLLFRSIP